MRHLASLLALASLTLALTAAPARAERPKVERLIPADAFLVLHGPNLTLSAKAFEKTGLGQLIAEPEVQALWKALTEPFQAQLKELRGKMEQELGVPLTEAATLLKGELAIALWRPAGEGPPVAGLAAMDCDAELFAKLVAKVGESKGVMVAQKDHLGTTIHLIPPKTAGGTTAAYALHEGRMLFSIVPAALEQAIALARTDGKASLAASKRYAAALAAHPAQGVTNARLVVDLVTVKAAFWDQAPPPVQQALSALELDQWSTLSYVSRFVDGNVVDSLHIATASTGGLARVIAPAAVDTSDLKAPADAMATAAGSFDLKALYEVVLATAKAASPDAAKQLEAKLAELTAESDFSLDKWLATLGKRYVVHSWMPRHGLLPESVIAIELADAEGYVAQLKAMAALAGAEWTTREYKGKTLHHWRVKLGTLGQAPFELGNEWEQVRFQLESSMPSHFIVEDGWAYFGQWHHALLNWIDRQGTGEWRAIEAPAGAVHVQRGNNARYLAGLYNTVLPGASMLEGLLRSAGVPFDARLLPRSSTLTRHLSGEMSVVVRRTDGGITLTSKDRVGSTPLAVAVSGIAAAVLLPTLAKARERAQRANSMNNLRQIGLGLLLWRDNQGRAVDYPPLDAMLARLYTDEVLSTPDVFSDPLSDYEVTDADLRNNRKDKLGYVATPYPIYSARGAAERPIVWDRGHGGTRVVLFLDGHVEQVTETHFQNLLRKLKERAAKFEAQKARPQHAAK